MTQNTHPDLKAMRQYFARIERIDRQKELDIIASKRFKYLGIEGDNKLYEERETGCLVKVFVPKIIKIPVA